MYSIEEDIRKASFILPFLRCREEFKNLPDEILVLATMGDQARHSYYGKRDDIQDFERANGLFEFLRQTGCDLSASYYLGMMYEEGFFVEQSDQKAFEYYLEACSPVNFNQEWQLGFSKSERSNMMVRIAKLIMNRGIIPADIDVEFAYLSATACLLSAAENSNSEATFLLQRMKYIGTISISPLELLKQASAGEIEKIQQLIYCYSDAAKMFPCLYEACLKWCATGEKIGDKECLYFRSKYIIEEDNIRRNKYPSNTKYYCFNEQLQAIIKHCTPISTVNEEKLRLQFIVHSPGQICLGMDCLSKYYHVANSPKELCKIRDLLTKFIESHAIFGYSEPEVEEPSLLKIRKAIDEQRYNLTWEASATYTGAKHARNFYFQDPVELFSDEWIARRVSVQRTKTRGKELYINGSVLSINCIGGHYKSLIRGSTGKIYECRFTIGPDDSVVTWHCNCPAFAKYDKACKHLVASFYAAEEYEKG